MDPKILDLNEALTVLWPTFRMVNKEYRAWALNQCYAENLELWRKISHSMTRLYEEIILRSDTMLFHLTPDETNSCLRMQIVFTGLSKFIHERMLRKFRALEMDDLLEMATDFDRHALKDLDAKGILGYAVISEMLQRVGELRLVTTLSPTGNLFNTCKIYETSVLYYRSLELRFMWPSKDM